MTPRLPLDTADIPGGGQLRLWRRGGDYSIMLGGNELMSSRVRGSESALAELACAGLPANAHVLIGGLGMGFTMRAAFAVLSPGAMVTVAELVPAVIGWAWGPMAELYGASLADPRLRIVEGDVVDLIRAGGPYDAILLDVDNGPDGLSRDSNGWLYGPAGLSAARRAIAKGGVLAVWSAAPDAAFARGLRDAGFVVDEVAVRGGAGGRGARHVIWLAR